MNFFGFSLFCIVIILTLMMPLFTVGMKIKVNYDNKQYPVEVNKKDTVATLKVKIQTIKEIGNIPAQNQVLIKQIFESALTDDQKTIDEYGIDEGQNVFVSWDEFQFFVEYKEQMIPITMKAMTTIKELKEKMTEITRIPSEEQTLILYPYGKCTDNSRLIDNDIVKDTLIIMSDGSGINVMWQQNREVIYVNGTDTVATVKEKIRAINKRRHKPMLKGVIKLSKCNYKCSYAKALADTKTMDEYGIGKGMTIYMTKESPPIMLSAVKKSSLPPSSAVKKGSSSSSSSAANAGVSKFHIHVYYGSAHTIVWVNGKDTVQSLKGKIRPEMEKAWSRKFGDIFLLKSPFRAGIDQLGDNNKTMNECGIKEGDIIGSPDAE